MIILKCFLVVVEIVRGLAVGIDGMSGRRRTATVVRLSASLLDRGDEDCQDFAASKARPLLRPRGYEPPRRAPWVTFPLGLVMDALNAVEFDGVDPDKAVARVLGATRAAVHPGLAVWVASACSAYLHGCAWIDDALRAEGIRLVPERLPRVVQHGSATELRMLTAWGRWYTSEDGEVREFRRLRMSRAGEQDAPSNLAIAYVAAAGHRAVGDVYRDLPVEVVTSDPPACRIRVVEVVLTDDALPRVVVDAPPEEVRRAYLDEVRPLSTSIARGGTRQPGADCAECKLRASCDALPEAPGLLGLADRGTHRRTWSVTTGRQYAICPAQAHLRGLHLPADPTVDGPAVRRGRLVHQWLEAAHRRRPTRACALHDLPDPDAPDLGLARESMTRDEYREVRPYLLAHLDVCPLGGADRITDLRTEPSVAVYDPTADVLVVARPDLVRVVSGRLVYREQKTTAQTIAGGGPAEVFAQVPQLALAVRLITFGVFRGHGRGLVELEVMTPSGAEVLAFDTADPLVVEAAREQVTRLVARWHGDTEFRAEPGPWCRPCPVARWCPDRCVTEEGAPIEADGLLVDPVTGEVVNGAPAVRPHAGPESGALSERSGTRHGDSLRADS